MRQESRPEAINDSSTSTAEQLVNPINNHEQTSTIVDERPIQEEIRTEELKEEVIVPVHTTHHTNDTSSDQHKPTQHSDKPAAKMEYLRPRIVVCGIGGAGCNAINYMMQEKCDGVEYYVINTDPQSLGYEPVHCIPCSDLCLVFHRAQIGFK